MVISDSSVLADIAKSEIAIENWVLGRLDDLDGFSELEQKAIIQVEKLKATSRIEFSNTLLRGKIIEGIDRLGLYSVHPNKYRTLEEMAQDVGISITQLSNITALYGYVFPYLQSSLSMSADEIWQISRANMSEVLPHLRMLISGEDSKSSSVRDSVSKILEEVDEIGGDDRVKSAVERIMEIASTGTNRMVRQHLNPERTPNIDAITFVSDDYHYVIAKLDEDQWIMFQRIIGKHFDISPSDIPAGFIEEVTEFI